MILPLSTTSSRSIATCLNKHSKVTQYRAQNVHEAAERLPMPLQRSGPGQFNRDFISDMYSLQFELRTLGALLSSLLVHHQSRLQGSKAGAKQVSHLSPAVLGGPFAVSSSAVASARNWLGDLGRRGVGVGDLKFGVLLVTKHDGGRRASKFAQSLKRKAIKSAQKTYQAGTSAVSVVRRGPVVPHPAFTDTKLEDGGYSRIRTCRET